MGALSSAATPATDRESTVYNYPSSTFDVATATDRRTKRDQERVKESGGSTFRNAHPLTGGKVHFLPNLAAVSIASSDLLVRASVKDDFGHVDSRASDGAGSVRPSFSHGTMTEWCSRVLPSPSLPPQLLHPHCVQCRSL